MAHEYSNPDRETDTCALPDIEVFQLTADEALGLLDDDTIYEYLRRFPLASMSRAQHTRMLDTMTAELGILGGFFWMSCFPGCLPDGDPVGPFATYQEALHDARTYAGG
jgi:hypothetical protein